MFRFRVITIFISCCIFTQVSFSQITAFNQKDTLRVSYTGGLSSDQMLLYGDDEAILWISAASDTTGWIYDWQKLDTITGNFVTYETDVDSIAMDTITTSGCYQVYCTHPMRETQVYRKWIYFMEDSLTLTPLFVDENDTLTSGVKCNSITVEFDCNYETIPYYNIVQDSDTTFHSDSTKLNANTYRIVDFEYSHGNENGDGIDLVGLQSFSASILALPYDTWISLKATLAGKIAKDTVYAKAKATEPQLNYLRMDYNKHEGFYTDTLGLDVQYKDNYGEWSDEIFTEDKATAPLWVAFNVDESKNATEYVIDFGDTLGIIDTLFYDLNQTIYKEYKYPGNYNVVLTTNNEYNCERETEPTTIRVTKTQFTFPNIIIKKNAGDGIKFRVEDVSVGNINVVIYNRTGRKVHEFYGDVRDWPGWNCEDNGKIANPGVYFFSFEIWGRGGGYWEGDAKYQSTTNIDGGNPPLNNTKADEDPSDSPPDDDIHISEGFFHLFDASN